MHELLFTVEDLASLTQVNTRTFNALTGLIDRARDEQGVVRLESHQPLADGSGYEATASTLL